jgi:hypothetical protein
MVLQLAVIVVAVLLTSCKRGTAVSSAPPVEPSLQSDAGTAPSIPIAPPVPYQPGDPQPYEVHMADPPGRMPPPTGNALLGPATPPGAVLDRILAGLRPGIRACYNLGLNDDPTMTGKLVISVRIAPNGEVESTDVITNSGISPQVLACIRRKFQNAPFDAPGLKGSTIRVPIVFASQERDG